MATTPAGTKAARALDDLYREHVGDVYRYAYAVLGNHADAEDVTQTTFVNALRALERGECPRRPGHWLIAIAHTIIRQRWRQESVRPAEVAMVADVAERDREETQPPLAELVRALQRIPPSQREAIVMRELEGRSYKEIAEILGITVGALETLLFRARRSLAEELDNLVTCDRAEAAISRRIDGRLGRKERRRLEEHLRECPACAAFAAGQQRHRKAMRGLALLPLPASLVLWKGAPSASAAASLPAIGLGAGTVAGSGTAIGTGAVVGTGASASGAAGGLVLGGVAAKAAAVVAAVGVAGGVSYEGVKQITDKPATPPPASARAVERASSASALSPNRVIPGKAKAAAAKARAQAKKRASAKQGAEKKTEAARRAALAKASKKPKPSVARSNADGTSAKQKPPKPTSRGPKAQPGRPKALLVGPNAKTRGAKVVKPERSARQPRPVKPKPERGARSDLASKKNQASG
jgi:RNA polymerase sigma factor (sigma-70 family)